MPVLYGYRPVSKAARDRGIDVPGVLLRNAMAECQVFFVNRALFELCRQRAMCHVGARDEHHPGGFAIESVDDARPGRTGDVREHREVVRQGKDAIKERERQRGTGTRRKAA